MTRYAAILVVAVALVCSACGGRSATAKAEDAYQVSLAQLDLGLSVSAGAPKSRLLAETNTLLDVLKNQSDDVRRTEIDKALLSAANGGCDQCVAALESKR